MQYSLLVFEIVFYNSCNIMGVAYKGVSIREGAGDGGVGGWVGKLKLGSLAIRPWIVVLCSQWATGSTIDRDAIGSSLAPNQF